MIINEQSMNCEAQTKLTCQASARDKCERAGVHPEKLAPVCLLTDGRASSGFPAADTGATAAETRGGDRARPGIKAQTPENSKLKNTAGNSKHLLCFQARGFTTAVRCDSGVGLAPVKPQT